MRLQFNKRKTVDVEPGGVQVREVTRSAARGALTLNGNVEVRRGTQAG